MSQYIHSKPGQAGTKRQRILGQKKILVCTGILDDSSIHVPQYVSALADLNEITFAGSSSYGAVIFTLINSICIKKWVMG